MNRKFDGSALEFAAFAQFVGTADLGL